MIRPTKTQQAFAIKLWLGTYGGFAAFALMFVE